MFKWARNTTLYRRIQLTFLFFIIIPIVLLSVISYYLVQKEIVDRFEQTNKQMLRVTAEEIGSLLDDIIFLSNVTASDGEFLQALSNLTNKTGLSSYQDYLDQTIVKDFIHLIESKTLRANAFVYYANNAGLIVYQSSPEDHDVIKNEWEQIKGDVNPATFQNVQWLGIKGDYYHIARNLRLMNSNTSVGTLVVKIPVKYFDKLFLIAEDANVSLWNEDNQTVIYPVDEGILDALIVNQAYVPHSPWYIKSELPREIVVGQMSGLVYGYIILLFSSLLILGFISSRLLRGMMKPLERLRTIVRRFGNGDYSERLSIQGQDDFAIVGHAFNRLLDEIGELIHRVEIEQEEKKIIELQALFAQIRPHFLFNTLNSIKYDLALNNDKVHSRQIDSLLRLLRNYMKVHTAHTLQEECFLVKDYLDIMNLRSGIAVQLKVEMEHAELLLIPRMILQPLIENAVVHAFHEDSEEPTIIIRTLYTKEWLQLYVEDNGLGINEEKKLALQRSLDAKKGEAEPDDQRVGLINVYRRLQITYGKKAKLELHAQQEGGTRILMFIPRNMLTYSDDSLAYNQQG